MIGFLWALFDEIRLRRMAKQTVAVDVYRRMRRYGKSLDVGSKLSDTPYEFTNSLTIRMQELGFQNMNPRFASDLYCDLQALTDEIVRISYRPSQPDLLLDSSVLRQWKSLRLKLWWLRILNYGRKRLRFVGRMWRMDVKQKKETL